MLVVTEDIVFDDLYWTAVWGLRSSAASGGGVAATTATWWSRSDDDGNGVEELVGSSLSISFSGSFFLLFFCFMFCFLLFCLRRRRVGDGGGRELWSGGEEVMTVVAK